MHSCDTRPSSAMGASATKCWWPAGNPSACSELVHDQEVLFSELLLKTQPALLVPGLEEFVHQRGGGGEPHPIALLTGRESQREGEMRLARKVRLMGRGPVSAGRVSQVISGHAACATVPRSHVRWLGDPPPRRSDRVSPGGESGPPGAPGPSAASPDRCPTPSTRRARPETRTARRDAGRRHRHS